MDIKYINPFLESFKRVMPNFGFQNVEKGELSLKSNELSCSGVIMIVGLVGEVKGSIAYSIKMEDALMTASKMMMGMPVDSFDEMAQSAISELANMLAANAVTCLSEVGILADISTPSLLYGEHVQVKMSTSKILCIELLVDDLSFEVNIAFET